MTVVIAYAATPEGDAALGATAAPTHVDAQESVVLVPVDRAHALPDAGAVAAAHPHLEGRLIVEQGDVATPSDAVVQVAQRHDARLIILGLARRSPVGKMIFGSTAQRILLDATCPVLAVKP